MAEEREDSAPNSATTEPRPASRSRAWLLIGLAVFVASSTYGLWRFRANYGDNTPTMTGAAFETARRTWRKAELEDYDIEIVVKNAGEEVYQVKVRGGLAREATRNGAALTQSRTFETWSVPGMFGTIASDWRHVEDRAAGKSQPGSPNLSLRAEFDPKWGYPTRYRRIEYGSAREVSWRVTKFEPVSGDAP